MAKKKRNKKYTPPSRKKLSVEQQIKMVYGDKKPYCFHCQTDAVLASDEDVKTYKQLHDPSYQFDFIFIPQCNCWETHDEWMDVK